MSNFSVSLDVTWEYPNGASIIIDGVKLIVVNVSSSSEGYYRCIVHSSLQRTVTAVGNLIIGMYPPRINITSRISILIESGLVEYIFKF